MAMWYLVPLHLPPQKMFGGGTRLSPKHFHVRAAQRGWRGVRSGGRQGTEPKLGPKVLEEAGVQTREALLAERGVLPEGTGEEGGRGYDTIGIS